MGYNTDELIQKVEAWLDDKFSGFKRDRFSETVLWHKVFYWVVSSDYLILFLAFNDMNYKFNGGFSVNMEEEDSDDFITEEFQNLDIDNFINAIDKGMKKHKNRISSAKYLQDMVRKNYNNTAVNLVNSIIKDANR